MSNSNALMQIDPYTELLPASSLPSSSLTASDVNRDMVSASKGLPSYFLDSKIARTEKQTRLVESYSRLHQAQSEAMEKYLRAQDRLRNIEQILINDRMQVQMERQKILATSALMQAEQEVKIAQYKSATAQEELRRYQIEQQMRPTPAAPAAPALTSQGYQNDKQILEHNERTALLECGDDYDQQMRVSAYFEEQQKALARKYGM